MFIHIHIIHTILKWANKIRCSSYRQESLVESGSRESGDDLLFVGREGGAASVEVW